MPCYRPLKGYRSQVRNPETGKRGIVFNARDGYFDQPVDLPCGQCIGCRLEHSRQWAMRCMHEAHYFPLKNCFVTLTYDDAHLPPGGSLDYSHPTLWMKRLRKKFGADIRSYGCGEYGEKFSRPHYHVCLFNFIPKDLVPHSKSGDFTIYKSASLQKTWKYGFVSVAEFSWETAAYVARYVTKKVTGDRAVRHYLNFNQVSGEIIERFPEKAVCVSRRPGLGRRWYDEFGQHSRDHDFLILRGKKMRPPKYYDRIFDVAFPEDFAKTKANRKTKALELSLLEPVPLLGERDRLYVKEMVHELKFKLLKRRYDNG